MFFGKLRHLFYWSVKEFVEQHASPYLRLRYTLELLLFLYCFARTVLLICGCLFEEKLSSYRHLDYLSSVFSSKSARLNEQTAFMLSMVVLFNFFAKSYTYEAGAPGKICMYKFYLYIVLNTDAFNENVFPQRKVSRIKRRLYLEIFNRHSNRIVWRLFPGLLSLFCSLKVSIQMAIQLKSINLKAVKARKLPPYFDITFKMRLKLYWMVRLAEMLAYSFGIFAYYFIFLISYFLLAHYRALISANWLYLAWILCDCLSFLYQFVTLYQTGFFYAFICIFSTPLISDLIGQYIGRLVSVKGKPSNEQAPICEYFFEQHHLLMMDIVRGNNELWDRTMSIFLLTNLAPNILLWTKLSFDELSPMDSLIYWILVIGQSFATLNSLFPVAANTALFHRPVKRLVSVQGAICGTLLWHKLKFDDLFKRLINVPKYGVTVKPLGIISYHNLAEGLFCYVAFLLYSFNYRINQTFI